jgi:hypothetical protein
MSSAPKLEFNSSFTLELADLKGPAEAECIGLSDQLTPEEILRYGTDFKIRHICQRQGLNFESAMKNAHVMLANPEDYFRFPCSTILRPDAVGEEAEKQVKLFDFKFTMSDQKTEALNEIINLMTSSAAGQTVIEDVVSVGDELFTNALYNAPFVDAVTGHNPGVSRHDTDIRLEDGKHGRLFLAMNESLLVVGCEDPYGSLNIDRYMRKIQATYSRGPAATMNFGPGGAGIGSYIMFNAGASLFFGVKPKQMTTLCCAIPLGMSYRKRVVLPKHLHWIQL